VYCGDYGLQAPFVGWGSTALAIFLLVSS